MKLLIVVLLLLTLGFAKVQVNQEQEDELEIKVKEALIEMHMDLDGDNPYAMKMYTLGMLSGLEYCPYCEQKVSPISKCKVKRQYHTDIVYKNKQES